MAKGTKLSAEKEAALSKELTVLQKYEILQALLHPRMKHVETIYITENGKYHFSQGHELTVGKQLDPNDEKDAKRIAITGKRFDKVKLEGTYINRSKVIDEIAKEDFLEDKEEIVAKYAEYLDEEREKKQRDIVDNPDPTAALLADALRSLADKKKAGK